MRKKSTAFFGLMCSVLLLCTFCAPKTETPTEAEVLAEVRVPVSAVPLVRRSLSDQLDLNGTTFYRKKENIRATSTGFLQGMKANVGDFLSSNTTFCTISTKEQAALKELANEPGFESLKDPIIIPSGEGGIIVSLNVQEGDYVSEGDVLATVAQPNSLVISLNVPYEYQRFISIGKSCSVVLPDARTLNGRVLKAMPTMDATSQTQIYYVEIKGASKLPENLNVGVVLTTGQRINALCAPMSAVQTDEMQQEFWVMKLIGDSVAVKIPITVGLRADSVQEVRSPQLSSTDRVVGEGAFGLADTVQVSLLEN